MQSSSHWLVEYQAASPIPVQQRVSAYPALNLILIYDPAGRLIELRHTIAIEAGKDAAAAVHASTRELVYFLSILEFGYSLPISFEPMRVTSVSTSNAYSGRRLGMRTLSVGFEVATTAKLPSEITLLQCNPDIAAALHMFNASRPPASDEEALRRYYFTLELLNSTKSKRNWDSRAKRVWFARDFVCHGEVLSRNLDAIAHIERGIGRPIERFDPLDRDHRQFIAEERRSAAAYVETLVSSLL